MVIMEAKVNRLERRLGVDAVEVVDDGPGCVGHGPDPEAGNVLSDVEPDADERREDDGPVEDAHRFVPPFSRSDATAS